MTSRPESLLARCLQRCAEPLRAARRRAADRALLREMNSRDLADIGIGAGEIDALLLSPPAALARR